MEDLMWLTLLWKEVKPKANVCAEHEHGGDPGSERDKRGSGLRWQWRWRQTRETFLHGDDHVDIDDYDDDDYDDDDYEENEDDCKLGRLFFTVITCFSHFSCVTQPLMFSTTLFCRWSIFFLCQVKYSFEKTALIVTINKCSNLPAKDKDNKTR